MVSIIEVESKPGFKDAFAQGKKEEIRNLGIEVDGIRRVNVYAVDTETPVASFADAAKALFSNPLTEDLNLDNPAESRMDDWKVMIHVQKRQGVKDNVGETTARVLDDMEVLNADSTDINTSIKYFIDADITKEQADKIAYEALGFASVDSWDILFREEYDSGGYTFKPPRVEIKGKPESQYISLDIGDDELVSLSNTRRLALNLEEMKAIRHYVGLTDVIEERKKHGMTDELTDVELEMLAQTWSEHCKHKIFNANIKLKEFNEPGENPTETEINSLFDTYIKGAVEEVIGAHGDESWVVSTLWDNSGVMKFNDKYYFCFKCETHNSPSAKHPFGGAITGIVGVYRDPMGTGMGARIIYGSYGFCTGFPLKEFEKAASKGVEFQHDITPERLLAGIHDGVLKGGNKSGNPTVFGQTFFNHGYAGKPGVYVETGGLIEVEKDGEMPSFDKMPKKDDFVIMIGGKVGIDGIHGATESSLSGGKNISLGHVQMGDPYTQKKVQEFLIEARKRRLYNCITDNGAGGLSSSVGEMSNDFGKHREEAAYGVEIFLDKVPLKYAGLQPWQILVSESQERMSLSVQEDDLEEFMELAAEFEVEATNIGQFNRSGKFVAKYGDKTVAYLDMEFLHGGVPGMELEAEWLSPKVRGLHEPELRGISKHGDFLKDMLARPNVCGQEYRIRQFDHEVQASSVIKPLVGEKSDVHSDGAVIRPDLHSDASLAIASVINPDFSEIDTYNMVGIVMDEAIRRIISVGGSLDQIAMNDNFIWPSVLPGKDNPEAKYKLAQLVRANQALKKYSVAYGTPCISGKDSMFGESWVPDQYDAEHKISCPPTIRFAAAGKMDSWEQAMTMDVKNAEDRVFVLGVTKDECGGSEYYKMMGEVGLNAPVVDAERNVRNYRALEKAMRAGIVNSVHGVYKGGLGVALAQSAFAGGYGMEIFLDKVHSEGIDREDKVLYSESAGRFVITVSKDNVAEFRDIMKSADKSEIGCTTDEKDFVVYGLTNKSKQLKGIIRENVYDLKGAWQSTFKHMLYQPEDKGLDTAKEVMV
jgi:phosphoribosylformylglycinamidine synthase